ncbi:MAG: TetR/AcrR family transcriptional regulator [Pikeienuella sp.]
MPPASAPQTQADRRAEIEAAAYEVLLEKGYKSASMLAVARRAKASNETMYRWYGDKAGLFQSLVTTNAADVAKRLRALEERDAINTLKRAAPILLAMVTGERAIALNRAAAANVAEGGELGRAIAERGRNEIAPLIANVMQRAAQEGHLQIEDPRQAADLFIRLLIGDLQIRRVIGALPPLTDAEIATRAAEAVATFQALHSTA